MLTRCEQLFKMYSGLRLTFANRKRSIPGQRLRNIADLLHFSRLLSDVMPLAAQSLDSGAARTKLAALVDFTNRQ
jgi:hypothetical protein